MYKLIDGRAWAKVHEEALKLKIQNLAKQPVLVSFLVGDDPGSVLYTDIKQRKALELGIDFRVESFLSDANPNKIAEKIRQLNTEQAIDGIMIQLPLPAHFSKEKTCELIGFIDPKKDVDGLLPSSPFMAATVRGIMSLVKDEEILLSNKIVVIVGAKGEVGSRLIKTLEGRVRRLIGIDKETHDIAPITKQADFLVSSTGKHGLITGGMVTEGVIVFDVGSEKLSSGQVVGDVDLESVAPKASKITPVPGGVGPMTVISLMENVVEASSRL